MVSMILAHNNFGIGLNKGLPWRIKEDLKHFKAVTYGKDLIVGRKTSETLPPLKGRRVHTVSRSSLSIEDAISQSSDPIIIGGAEVYHYCLDHGLVDEIISTEIQGDYECDTFIRENFFSGFEVYKEDALGDHVVKWYRKI